MRKKFLHTFIILFSFHLAAHAQEKPIIIPFELTKHNKLAVQAILNKKDTVCLMFHKRKSSLVIWLFYA